ncbi:hypothetical protein NC652_000482 [Populus alba x Populus x berolinensis]|nr:hypothetical protein NC652_000482 [Populus alba x Populus x berolinensis]
MNEHSQFSEGNQNFIKAIIIFIVSWHHLQRNDRTLSPFHATTTLRNSSCSKNSGEDAAEREEEALEGRKSLLSNMEIPDLRSRMERRRLSCEGEKKQSSFGASWKRKDKTSRKAPHGLMRK